MRLAILTSTDIRHRYFVNAVRRRFPVAAVGYERTGYAPAARADDAGLTDAERSIIRHHFAERARQEELYFGHDAAPVADSPNTRVLPISTATLNSAATLAFLESAGVDAVAVFGTNLIRSPLLERFGGRMINLHLGLSPYYRGTATNFYPLLYGEPEYVGATVHLIDRGIDAGPILHHARPDITADDMPHTIGCKAIQAGINKMLLALRELDEGRLRPVPQWPVATARLCLRKDYDPRDVVRLYEKIQAGLIRDYVGRAGEARARVKLVD